MQKKYRINLVIVGQTLLLMAVSLGILFYFSHKALKHEAMSDAEHTLEGTVQNIDNILLSVEQSTGNIYYDLLDHVDEPERMYTYCRELVLSNPNIVGCAIAFKPGYFPDRDLFMTYVHRRAFVTDVKSDLVTTDKFTDRPYTEQVWYAEPMKTGYVGWTDPLKGDDTENEPLVNFCLPFENKAGERVGVIAVDVSISQFSKIVLAVKPSERGYCVLMAKNGSFIVHPNEHKLESQTVFTQMNEGADHSVLEAAEAMLSGQSGMKNFKMNGENWSVFYKPFQRVEWEGRSSAQLGWSVGVVYPESDIHNVHYTLLGFVIIIALVCLVAFCLLCGWIIRRELNPLKLLTMSTQRVADGHYDETVPESSLDDEMGHLQNRFRTMQLKLCEQTAEVENETVQLQHHSDELRAAYGRLEESDRMKTSFLHYMTNQMAVPAESLDRSVTTLCNNYSNMSKEEIDTQVDNIERKSETLIELLNHMAHFTESETGKEADND